MIVLGSRESSQAAAMVVNSCNSSQPHSPADAARAAEPTPGEHAAETAAAAGAAAEEVEKIRRADGEDLVQVILHTEPCCCMLTGSSTDCMLTASSIEYCIATPVFAVSQSPLSGMSCSRRCCWMACGCQRRHRRLLPLPPDLRFSSCALLADAAAAAGHFFPSSCIRCFRD